MKTWPTTRCVMTRFVFLFYASFCLHLIQVNTAPLDPEKTGDKDEHENAGPEQSTLDSMEEKVQETVHKAEQAASQAAQESVRHGHKAETRVLAVKNTEHVHAHGSENSDTSETDKHDKKHQVGVSTENKRNFKVEVRDSWQAKAHYNPLLEAKEGKTEQGIKQHRLHHKMEGISKVDAGLGPLSLMGTAGSNAYKEDTKLEDRLAMEAEEEKKFENGESYGGYDEGVATDKSANWESNIQRQDAAEKQSIQAQVASESANELNQIQQAIATESQTSQGTASIGDGGATVVQVGANGMQNGNRPREQEQARARAESSMESPPKVEQQEIANIISQADKLSPSELKGPPPAALSAAIHTGLGSLQNREQASLGSQDFQQALGGGEAGQEQSMEQGMPQPSEQAFTQSFNQEASQAQPETGGAEGLNPEQAAFTGNSLLSTQSQSAALQSPSPNLLANQPFQTQTQGNEQALTRTAETGTSLGGSIGGNMLAGQGAMLTQGSTQSLMGQGGLAQQGFVAAPMAQGMTGMTQGMVGQMPVVGGLQPMTFKKSFIPKHKQRHPDKLTIQRSKLDKISEVKEKSNKKILKGKQNVVNGKLSVTSHRGKQSKKSKLSRTPLGQ